jgi:hypothetical protein
VVVVLGSCPLWFVGCGQREKPLTLAVETSDIIVPEKIEGAAPIEVDFCLDATPSMEGFATDPASSYRKLLEDMEGDFISSAPKGSDGRYFKFGESIRRISRQQFLEARSRSFYNEPGILRETNIELILQADRDRHAEKQKGSFAGAVGRSKPPSTRVTVAITDLFQKDQDANRIVQQIKDGCLANAGCSVGILAVPSAFDGMVYDARVPSFRYRSTEDSSTFRPFYLLMFGPETQLVRLASILSGRSYIDGKNFLLIGPRVVDGFTVVTEIPKGLEGISKNDKASSGLISVLNLKKGIEQAKVNATIAVTSYPDAYPFEPKRLNLRFLRRQGKERISADTEVVAGPITGEPGALRVELAIRPPQEKGDYVYEGELRVGEVNGFQLPAWVRVWSSSNPTPSHEPAKTLNLDRLVERLIATSIFQDHHRPILARFRITLRRR